MLLGRTKPELAKQLKAAAGVKAKSSNSLIIAAPGIAASPAVA